jgi:arylsulfatase
LHGDIRGKLKVQTQLGALRFDDWKYQFIQQPQGWLGAVERPSIPRMTNLRQDPFERMNWSAGGFTEGSVAYWDSFKHEMWRLQIPLQFIVKYSETLVAYPPMQAGASADSNSKKRSLAPSINRSRPMMPQVGPTRREIRQANSCSLRPGKNAEQRPSTA